MPTEHQLKVERTARYYTDGTWGSNTTRLWIVCHGYAQLASDFIKQFDVLLDGKTAIVAPEALSRFYPKTTNPYVGATWMTREDRLNEIEDYVKYMDKVYQQVTAQLPNLSEIHILGFSQGTSTVSRWVAARQPICQHVWLCAGDVPADIDHAGLRKALQTAQLHLLLGTDDTIVPLNKAEPVKQRLADEHITYDLQLFNGGHIVDVSLIKQLAG